MELTDGEQPGTSISGVPITPDQIQPLKKAWNQQIGSTRIFTDNQKKAHATQGDEEDK